MTHTVKYREWYEANRERLSIKRRLRYQNDEAFRASVNARNRKNRMEAKADRPAKPEQYTHDMAAAASELEITVSSLRWWMTQGYYPRPYMYNGKFWFTTAQVDLLRPIAEFFDCAVDKNDSISRGALEILKTTALMNWGN